jgi:hypothetical protein
MIPACDILEKAKLERQSGEGERMNAEFRGF